MIDKAGPWYGTVQPARVTRVDDGCAEWECSHCGQRWTTKDCYPGEAFAFWPADIDDALSDEMTPLGL